MGHPLATTPGKVIAVHANYRSRAAQRGREPKYPSYFLKPSSSLSGSDDPVVRPVGCELLTFEGEIALVIGTAAREVPVEQAWEHVAWVTAGNDFGVNDLRYADAGSNVRAKGGDGYTPLGPSLLDARTVDPRALTLRAWVNGELLQETETADDLIFDFDVLVADLSRLMTLEPGDVILTGTPAGAGVVEPGDVVEVEVFGAAGTTGKLRNRIEQADHELSPIGAMPRVDEATRAFALGIPPGQPEEDLADVLETLRTVATATLTVQLRKRGLDNVVLQGLRPTRPDLRLVGRARTLRYLPLREDLAPDRLPGMNAQKTAVEEVKPGEVLVIDARGEPGAGTMGDILALRVRQRGGAGIVTDGALRDIEPITALDLPVYHASVNPAIVGRRHLPWESGTPIACAGVLVQPGDVLVGDADGVVVVPAGLAREVTVDVVEQERQERFIAERVAAGEAIDGLFPLGPDRLPAYQEWCAAQEAAARR